MAFQNQSWFGRRILLRPLVNWSARRTLRRRSWVHGLLLEQLEYRNMLAVIPMNDLMGEEIVAARAAAAEFDFGDAPEPYPTTDARDGARHEAIGPTLGATRDAEIDGQPSSGADGDGADDDGVTFASIQVGQTDAAVIVNVQHAPTGAKLDAWIDFNGDGSWGGPLDQIADAVDVIEGNYSLSFDVPSWAVSGQTFARFRLSTAGDLGVGGAASDGEVEDYALTIDPPAALSGLFTSQIIVSTASDQP